MSDENKTEATESNEEVYIAPQLTLELLTKPSAGDNAEVYPTNDGWVAKYPDGSEEVLIECKNLKAEFDKMGLDDNAKPIEGGKVHTQLQTAQTGGRVFQRGEVISSTITQELLDSLDMNGLRRIGNVLGVKGTSKEQLSADIAEKVGLNKSNT